MYEYHNFVKKYLKRKRSSDEKYLNLTKSICNSYCNLFKKVYVTSRTVKRRPNGLLIVPNKLIVVNKTLVAWQKENKKKKLRSIKDIIGKKNGKESKNRKENGDNGSEPNAISDQIREQLKLLQTGKRDGCLFAKDNERVVVEDNSVQIETVVDSINSSDSNKNGVVTNGDITEHKNSIDERSSPNRLDSDKVIEKNQWIENTDVSECNEESAPVQNNLSVGDGIDDNLPEEQNFTKLNGNSSNGECSPPRKKLTLEKSDSVVDSLINKFNIQTPNKSTVLHSSCIPNENTDDEMVNESVDEYAVEQSNIPGSLPTPIVKSTNRISSVFVSEELNSFLKENSIGNEGNDEKCGLLVPVASHQLRDDACIYENSEPPRLECLPRPVLKEKPRTVAEKRLLLNRNHQSDDYLIAENESTVYRELRRRSKNEEHNYQMITAIQGSLLPCRRDCWKAMSWLNTKQGYFFYQVVKYGDTEIKVVGGIGNNRNKCLFTIDSPERMIEKLTKWKHMNRSCNPLRCKYLRSPFKLIPVGRPPQAITKKEKNLISFIKKPIKKISTKPGPLNSKQESAPDLKICNMPVIQLEVTPKIGKPIHSNAIPYLKHIWPSNNITPEWAEFASSVLRVNSSKETTKISKHLFNINYKNNQKRVIGVKKRSEKDELSKYNGSKDEDIEMNNDTKFTFMKAVDVNDTTGLEVAECLSNMISSVAIGMSENSVIKLDESIPDEKPNSPDEIVFVNSPTIEVKDPKDSKTRKSLTSKVNHRVLNELKRLNAKIIETNTEDTGLSCTKDFCKLGCICSSLCGQLTPKYCSGSADQVGESSHHEDIKYLRDCATANLAKEEKQFTSAIILTDAEAIVVGHVDNERRRSTRIPKRYREVENCLDYDSSSNSSLPPEPENQIPVKVNLERNKISASTLDKILHTTVVLDKLKFHRHVEPWCMVHHLYKCFCKGKAITGEPYHITNVSKNSSSFQPTSNYADSMEFLARKRAYEFEGRSDRQFKRVRTVQDVRLIECARCKPVVVKYYTQNNRARKPEIIKRAQAEKKYASYLRKKVESTVKSNDTELTVHIEPIKHHGRIEQNNDDQPKRLVMKIKNGNIVNNTASESQQLRRSSRALESLAQITSDMKSIRTSIEKSPKSTRSSVSIDSSDTQPSGELRSSSKNSTSHPFPVSKLNNMVSACMQKISLSQKSNNERFPPVKFGELQTVLWNSILRYYSSNMIFIWEVRLSDNYLFVITTTNEMPIYRNAFSVINLRALDLSRMDKYPLLVKMLLNGIQNERTSRLSLLLIGEHKYFRILGMLHSPEINYLETEVVQKPTPETHPHVAPKIAHVFEILNRWSLERHAKREGGQNEIIEDNRENEKSGPSTLNKKKIIPVNEPSTSGAQIPRTKGLNTTTEMTENINFPSKDIANTNWFMLTMYDDFSHIHIPSWGSAVSINDIKEGLRRATAEKKKVYLSRRNCKPLILFVPNQPKNLFFGPYRKDAQIDFVLCHAYQGQLIPREKFEQINNIKREKRTIGRWLMNSVKLNRVEDQHTDDQKEEKSENLKEDDDCVIVESLSNDEQQPVEKEQPTKSLESVKKSVHKSENDKPELKLVISGLKNYKSASSTVKSNDPVKEPVKLTTSNPILKSKINKSETVTNLIKTQFPNLPNSLVVSLTAPVKGNEFEKVDENSYDKQKTVQSSSTRAVRKKITSKLGSGNERRSFDIPSTSKKTEVNAASTSRCSLDSIPHLTRLNHSVSPLESTLASKQYGTNLTAKQYVVSDIVDLGRIPVESFLGSGGIVIKLPTMNNSLRVQTMEIMNNYLNRYIRQHIFAFVPEATVLKWRIVSTADEYDKYPDLTAKIIKPSMVLTCERLVDLHSDFINMDDLPRGAKDHLAILLLAKSFMDKDEIRSATGARILETGIEVIDQLKKKQMVLESEIKKLTTKQTALKQFIQINNKGSFTKATMKRSIDVIQPDSDDDDVIIINDQ